MIENDFDGTLILELLAEHGLMDDFYEAVDSDNLPKVVSLMRQAQIDEESINQVILAIKD